MGKERIPILDLSAEIDSLWDELQIAIQGVLKSGQFISGPNVEAFEREVSDYLGVKYAVGVNSGTDALVIALKSAGIASGDEVITTPFTFFATAEAISQVGATPVFVDVDPDTFNIDVNQLDEAVTARTKAILPVHLYGQAVDVAGVLEVARRHHLLMLEDVAQAFGGAYCGQKLGTFGIAAAFSFFPTKTLGAYGDAGMLVTNDDDIADQARMLRVHGSKRKYYNEAVGYNSRLDELQAAILRVKLRHIEEWNKARKAIAQRYDELLHDIPNVVVPKVAPGASHVYHQYTIRVLGGHRAAVQQTLGALGIGTMVYYPIPVHQLPVYRSLGISLPVAERLAGEVLSLPMWPNITSGMQDEVVNGLGSAIRSCI